LSHTLVHATDGADAMDAASAQDREIRRRTRPFCPVHEAATSDPGEVWVPAPSGLSWYLARALNRFASTLAPALVATVALAACEQPPSTHRSGGLDSRAGAVLEKGVAAAAPAAAEVPDLKLAVAPDNGWGAQYPWRSFDDAKTEAAATGKPMMMIVHTAWCPKCKALKADFQGNGEISELAKRFVLVNVNQDDEPWAQQYGPDGKYIPRVLFFDSSGTLDESLDAQMSPKFKYFYVAGQSLPSAMRRALDRHGQA
jgi:protein-disulfide reductase (glutathione)